MKRKRFTAALVFIIFITGFSNLSADKLFQDDEEPRFEETESIYFGEETCGRYLKIKKFENRAVAKEPTPVMLLRGGGWKGFTPYPAITINSLTDRGFVVYLPEYRFIKRVDEGFSGCQPIDIDYHDGSRETIDIDHGSWLKTATDVIWAIHAIKKDAGSEKVNLFGASAGAHLVNLLRHYNGDVIGGDVVNRVVLVSPLADFQDFVNHYPGDDIFGDTDYLNWTKYPSNGEIYKFGTIDTPDTPYWIFKQFLISDIDGSEGEDINQKIADAIDINTTTFNYIDGVGNSSKVTQNHPPVFIIAGKKDSLVPHIMSKLLCDAYNEEMYSKQNILNWSDDAINLRTIFKCGNGAAELHLFRDLGHTPFPILCDSGLEFCDEENKPSLIETYEQAADFLLQ